MPVTPVAPVAPGRPAPHVAAALAVAAIAFTCYTPTLRFGFVTWDDNLNITENPFLNPPSLAGIARLWVQPYGDLYVPLVYTTYAVEVLLAAGKPWIFHLTNVFLHAISSVVVLLLLRTLVPDLAAACAGALLFALHPVQVEAVAWATGRKDLLCGLFWLVALYEYARWRQVGGMRRYVLSTMSLLLALFAKPTAAAAPLMAMAMDRWAFRCNWKNALRAAIPWLALAALWTVMTSRAQPISRSVGLHMRPFVAGDALVFYLRTILAPFNLVPIYARNPWELTDIRAWWLGLPLTIVALGLLWRAGDRVKLAATLFLAGLLPVLGLKQFRFQNYSTVADRYLYVSMLGVSLLAAHGIQLLCASRPRGRRVVLQGAMLLALVLAALSLRQQRVWQSSEVLWQRVLEHAPEYGPAHSNMGIADLNANRVDSAIDHFRKALLTLDSMADVHNNLGAALLRKSRHAEALAEYRRAAQIDPKMASAWNGIGQTYQQWGKPADAIPNFEKAIALEPTRRVSRVNLGLCHAATDQLPDAVSQYETALKMQPDADVYGFLAQALARLGRRAEAEQAAAKSLQLNPGNAEALEARRMLAGQ